MTSGEVLSKLEEAWRNEKFAPDLLAARSDLVDCVMEQLTAMEANLERAKKGDIRIAIHRLELDRIRFILADYLRCRLRKIEINAGGFQVQANAEWIVIKRLLRVITINPVGGQPPSGLLAALREYLVFFKLLLISNTIS
jgi:hypothetical protein